MHLRAHVQPTASGQSRRDTPRSLPATGARCRALVAMAATSLALLSWTSSLPAAASGVAEPATATTYSAVVDQWTMTVVDGRAAAFGASPPMSLYGDWRSVQGQVGGAVEFEKASSFGVADGTGAHNPKKLNFAFGAMFRSSPIPNGYSGNLVQKGFWEDAGQIKLQLVPDGGGTVNCRIKGSRTAKFISSSVLVGDNQWHSALCWREGTTLGLTVDGVTSTMAASVGYIANSRPLNVANKTATSTWSDQLIGAIDCAVLATGADARPAAAAAMPC
jgi:hypothetical protein